MTWIHQLCCDYEIRVLLMRATRKSLTESVLVTYEEEVLKEDGMQHIAYGATRGHRDAYHYPNGSIIVNCGLDRNPGTVLSTSWHIVYVNEACEVKEDAYETVTSRTDRPEQSGKAGKFGWVVVDTNPWAPDHYLKRRADEGIIEHWETTHKANPSMWDGQNWTEAGERYLARLRNLTGVRRKRLLDGLWVQGEGVWFDTFDRNIHCRNVSYNQSLPLYISVDSGVRCGAVFFQVFPDYGGIHVLADYFKEGKSAEENGKEIIEIARSIDLSQGTRIVSTDSAGDSRNPVGPTVIAEFVRVGLSGTGNRILRWPKFPGCVTDGLNLIEAFVGGTEDIPPALFIHPRCKHLLNAFENYSRAKVGGVLMDWPLDPQHPYEDMIDSLRGGLKISCPNGRKQQPTFIRVNPRKVM